MTSLNEDSLVISRRRPARANAEQVAKLARALAELGYEVATPTARARFAPKGADRTAF